nr:hypothetical protein [Desulfonatronum thiosulfatophilum]
MVEKDSTKQGLLTHLKVGKAFFIFNPLAFHVFHFTQWRALKKMNAKKLNVFFGSLDQNFQAIIVQAPNPTCQGKVFRFIHDPFLELTPRNCTCGLTGKHAVKASGHLYPPGA